VLTTIGWLATLYAWRQAWKHKGQQQQAWQWWQQQQTIQSHHTAESIRDGLLQQTFAFRRYLETIGETVERADRSAAPQNQTEAQTKTQTAQWLTRFQTFHQSLETLSDTLSPPFVADSLPHALQFTIKSWQSAQSLPVFHIELPQRWTYGQSTPPQNQTVLSVVNTLLSLLLPPGHSATKATAKLSSQNVSNTLTVKIEYKEQSIEQAQPELKYLMEIFHSLTAGQLEITHETLAITSCFSWQNNEPVSE